jgi:hypothetical protein
MDFNHTELREFLSQQPTFEYHLKKCAWTCNIKDNTELTALQMLELNAKISPSSIVVILDDGTITEFWMDVYLNQKDTLYHERLESYSKYYLVY